MFKPYTSFDISPRKKCELDELRFFFASNTSIVYADEIFFPTRLYIHNLSLSMKYTGYICIGAFVSPNNHSRCKLDS